MWIMMKLQGQSTLSPVKRLILASPCEVFEILEGRNNWSGLNVSWAATFIAITHQGRVKIFLGSRPRIHARIQGSGPWDPWSYPACMVFRDVTHVSLLMTNTGNLTDYSLKSINVELQLVSYHTGVFPTLGRCSVTREK